MLHETPPPTIAGLKFRLGELYAIERKFTSKTDLHTRTKTYDQIVKTQEAIDKLMGDSKL